MVIKLHPTYKVPLRTVKCLQNAPLKFDSLSYGSFEIDITLHWKKEIKMPDESTSFTC